MQLGFAREEEDIRGVSPGKQTDVSSRRSPHADVLSHVASLNVPPKRLAYEETVFSSQRRHLPAANAPREPIKPSRSSVIS